MLLILLPLFSMAQQKFVYCELASSNKALSTKAVIQISFGQHMNALKDNRLKDPAGKLVVFDSHIDALNYLGLQGWELVQAYVVNGSLGTTNFYILKKRFDDLTTEEKKLYE